MDSGVKAKTSTVSSKGQVTIPLEIRTRLGLKEGDRVEFVVEKEKTVLRPVRAHKNPFDRYVGAYPAFKSVKEINAWVREMRDDEPEQK
jgi:AbrB family looped-hinge helix DNA binding protein